MQVTIEGLDLSGKTTVAQYLEDELEDHSYHKVSVGDAFDYDDLEEEKAINRRIMEEMVHVTEGMDDIIMDRGAYSTAATGSILDDELEYDELIEQRPEDLVTDVGIVITCSEETIGQRREEADLTEQDEEVLAGPYFETQERMAEDLTDEYIHVVNDFKTVDALYDHLEAEVVPELRDRLGSDGSGD